VKNALLIFFCFAVFPAFSQIAYTEEGFKEYFKKNADSLDQIEGIWNVSTMQEYHHFDTLYDVIKFPKAAKVAIIKREGKFESFNLTGTYYDVQFDHTDVKGVYLYRNYFPETKQYSKTQAVISKADEMEYTYEFPEDYLRIKLAESYEEGTRVVNILKWTKAFPIK
jgi:hypothetical protein